MGKKRQSNKHLPRRLYQKGRAYYYVTRDNRWLNLGRDYPAALAEWAKLEGAHNPGNGLVAGAIDRYIIEDLPKLAPKTRTDRARILERLRRVFGAMPLDQVKPIHVREYLDRRSAKVAANRDIAVLSTLYTCAINWGWTERNPCTGIRRHRERPRDRHISDAELEALKVAADPTYRAIIELAYLTAARRADVLELRLADITDDGIYIRQNKTGHRQRFTWTPALRQAIAAAKLARKTRNIEYLFTSRHGQPITITAFNSAWRRLRARAGLEDIHFHDIRGKTLTDARRQRGLDYAQDLGGHSNRNQTEAYVRARTIADVEPLR